MEKDFGPEATPIEYDSATFPESRARKDQFSDLPEVDHDANIPEVVKQPTGHDDTPVEVSGEDIKRERLLCGLRRTVAIAILAAITVIIIVIAGAVGGVLGSRSKAAHTIGTNSDTSTPSNLPNPPSDTTITVPVPEPIRSIAAAQGSGALLHVWQKADASLHIRIYNRLTGGRASDKWGDPFPLDISSVAINNTPIAATTVKSDDTFEVRVHYVASGPNTLTSLIFRCNATSCANSTNTPVAGSPALSPGSGLALVAPGPGLRRQYFVNNESLITEAILNSKSDWNPPKPISDKFRAHKASPVTAAMVNSDIWIFWFNEAKMLQLTRSDGTTGDWSKVQNITAPIPNQLPRALGVAVSEKPNLSVQIFFHDGTKIQRTRYASGQWTTGESGSGIPDANIANGPMGIAGWNDTQVRMYYPVAGRNALKEVAFLGSGAWRTATDWEDDY